MSSKRSKRTTRNSKKASAKHSEQLFMTVMDHGATISVSNAQNHFGYALFDLTITVKPQTNDLEPQPLAVQLVFEDGQQIDLQNSKNNIQFETNPSKLFIDKNGHCKFSVTINTYSMFHDNRAFKLIFMTEGATRHIRPCETKPFRLVKHRLEIVTEPDDTFYKDEGGRANCLRCKILLKDSMRNTVKNRDIPLTAKLVYEDMSVAQSSRDILEILTQNVELKKGQCCVDFRINEVSKNHNKRAFRVLYECKSNDALYHDISSCVTNKIMVKSKRTKKKGTHSSKGRRGQNKKKRKRETKKKVSPVTYASISSSDGSQGDRESDDHNEPLRKKQRRSRRYDNPYSHDFDPHLSSTLPSSVLNGADNDGTQYVPPALTGILPSIRPGALPRIGHQPPPFANYSKKNPMLKQEKNGMGGGVLGHMFAWCKLAGWVMNRLEWTHCGYEYDEATHSIDTRRPLYRCSYCLKYRNEAGWGQHENWCQLSLALKEYENRVKTLYCEWKYQMNNKDVSAHGGMTTLDHQSGSPPPTNTNNKDANKIPAPFSHNTNNAPPPPLNAPFLLTPNPSNGGLWSFNPPFGANNNNAMNGLYAPAHAPPPQFTGYNDKPAVNNEVKHELFAPTNNNINDNNMTLPNNMTKISSVSRVRSQHGYDAYDKDNNFVGIFDDEGAFYDAQQFNEQYEPTFDHTNMLWRNQSDDYLFYNHLRNNIFDKT
eukprot:35280_1